MENDPRWQPPMNEPYVSPGAGRPPAYAPYQRPAPPPVYGPPQPAYRPFVPPADNSCPMTATVCHRLNASQYDRVHRRTEKRALPVGLAIAAAVALLLFGYNAAVPFQLYTRDWQTLLFIGLEFLCLCAVVGMIPLLLHRRTVWRAKHFAAYMDSEPEESVIELYGDRAVQVSARGKTVIDYRLADFLLESADLIVLGGQGQVIAWRAEDMDPAGAQLVLACLTYMVRPAYFRRDGMFTPWLRQPLPVPVFSGGEEVWMTVSVDEEELQSRPVSVCFAGAAAAGRSAGYGVFPHPVHPAGLGDIYGDCAGGSGGPQPAHLRLATYDGGRGHPDGTASLHPIGVGPAPGRNRLLHRSPAYPDTGSPEGRAAANALRPPGNPLALCGFAGHSQIHPVSIGKR